MSFLDRYAMPNGFVRTEALDGSWTVPDGLGVRGGFAGQAPNSTVAPAFAGNDRELHVNLGEDARLDVTFHDLKPWPHRLAGGSSIFQSIPSLNQYWHPWLPGGRASGRATVGGETWEFDGAQVYSEKNWGREASRRRGGGARRRASPSRRRRWRSRAASSRRGRCGWR